MDNSRRDFFSDMFILLFGPDEINFMDTLEDKEHSDGSTADYYKLPERATELQDLISFKDMNAQIGEVFRACYRYGEVAHSTKLRDAKKMRFYINAEIERLEAEWDK